MHPSHKVAWCLPNPPGQVFAFKVKVSFTLKRPRETSRQLGHVHVHVNLPSRQDAQPQVPWRHNVGGAECGAHTHGHTHDFPQPAEAEVLSQPW